MLFQYFISKRLKIFETKLIIFRRVYKQLYLIILIHGEEVIGLKRNSGINAMRAVEQSGLSIEKDLGDMLYYVDGKLEEMTRSLICTLYQEGAIIGKPELDNMGKIMEKLKKMI